MELGTGRRELRAGPRELAAFSRKVCSRPALIQKEGESEGVGKEG